MTKLKKIKKTSQHRKQSAHAKFASALERYNRIQKQNANFEAEVQSLAERVIPKIKEHEAQKLESLHSLTLKLAGFFDRKTLPEYLREELEDWVCENLDMLTYSPFSDHIDTSPIQTAMSNGAMNLVKHKHDKTLNKLKKDGCSQQEIDDLSDLLEKMRNAGSEEELEKIMADEFFSDADDQKNNEETYFSGDLFGDEELLEDAFDFDFNDNTSNDFEHENDPDKESEKQLEKLLKSTSFNKIFRRIAKAIHPDLTQDEAEKQQRHQQMSELIEARSNKDIAQLIQIHTHVLGEPPADISDADYPKLIKLLNSRIEKLKREKLNVLADSPFNRNIYEWFNAKNLAQENNKIKKYLKQLEQEAQMFGEITQEITSITRLRPFLEARYETAFMHDLY